MQIRINELFGLPAHSLLIHLSVMLVPIATFVAIWLAARPNLLSKWRWPFVALSAAAVVSVWVTSGAGEELHDSLKAADPAVFVGIESFPTHEVRGRNMIPFINWFAIAIGLWLVLDQFSRRSSADNSDGAKGATNALRLGVIGSRALVVAVAVWVTYYLILAGHSGAQSVWS